MTLSSEWQRSEQTWTIPATVGESGPVPNNLSLFVVAAGAFPAGAYMFIDGVQLEQKAFTTPYIDTNGATASRPAALVQATSSLLGEAQGWIAARLRMGWPSTTLPNPAPIVFEWRNATAPENQISLWRSTTTQWTVDGRRNGTFSQVSVSATHAKDDLITLIAAWANTEIKLSVNGAAFTVVTRGGTVGGNALPSLFEIGGRVGGGFEVNSDVLWLASGIGALTNGDAAVINAFGNSDPTPRSFPSSASATATWSADSPALTLASTPQPIAVITDPAVTRYVDTTAAPNSTFTYRVVTVTGPTPGSHPSNRVTVTTPADGYAWAIFQPDATAATATSIHSANPGSNYGSQGTLYAQGGPAARSLLKFDLRQIAASATVSSATLGLYDSYLSGSPGPVGVYRVTSDWNESQATWNQRLSAVNWTTAGGDFDPTAAATLSSFTTQGWDEFNLTALVQAWIAGTQSNFGLLLKQTTETSGFVQWNSDDWPFGRSLTPKLTVTYLDGSHALPPFVSMGAPGPNTISGSNVQVTAAASDDGGVTRVEFLVDGALHTTVTAGPWTSTINSTTLARGTHTISAKAYDNAGNTSTSSISVNVANSSTPTVTAPVVTTIDGNTYVSTTASDDRAIARVEFYANGELVGVDTTAPYSIPWNTRPGDLPGSPTLVWTANAVAAETATGTVQLVASGNEITDATRESSEQGDGRAAGDSSFGIWEGTTNLIPNGGFEANTTGWANVSGTLARSTAQKKLGAASGEMPARNNVIADAQISGATAGRKFTASFWVYDVVENVQYQVQEVGGALGNANVVGLLSISASAGQWQRVTATGTVVQNDRTAIRLQIVNNSDLRTIHIDGVQIEEQPIATSYVETNGATASRGWPRVQAPASSLDPALGWFAARVRVAWSNTQSDGDKTVLTLFKDPNNFLRLYVNTANGQTVMNAADAGAVLYAIATVVYAPGELVTFVGRWNSSGVALSVNGAAFATAGTSRTPFLTPIRFDVGSYEGVNVLDGDVLWFAAGAGTLTDADAAKLHVLGNGDPALPGIYDGTYTLTAKAIDDDAQVTTSAATNHTVANTTGTKYRIGFTSTAVPAEISSDPAVLWPIDITLTNNATTNLLASQTVLRYHWRSADGTLTTSGNIALGGDIAPNANRTVRVNLAPPTLLANIARARYTVSFDLHDTTIANDFARQGNRPLEQTVTVNSTTPIRLGLERFHYYDGEDLGAGITSALNLANGNNVITWTPFNQPGIGLNTVVTITYNSLEHGSTSPLGNNITLAISGLTPFGAPLDVHPNGSDSLAGRSTNWIGFVDADGSYHVFTGQTAGATVYWSAPPGVHLYLRQYSSTDTNRWWAVTKPDRTTFFFDQQGQPTFVEDGNGNTLTYTLTPVPAGEDAYSAAKRVTSVTDAGGRSFTISYYTAAESVRAPIRGKVKAISDHLGHALQFSYYDDGNLLRITEAGGVNADGSWQPSRSLVFTYTTPDGSSPAIPTLAARQNPSAATSQSTKLFGLIDYRGAETSFSYVATVGATQWRVANRTDRAGNTSSFAYNVATLTTTATHPLGRVWTYTLDSAGRLITILNPLLQTTNVVWTADNAVARVSEPGGRVTDYTYNQNGYLTSTKSSGNTLGLLNIANAEPRTSAFGLWEGSTNLGPNGGFEADLSLWYPNGGTGASDNCHSSLARVGADVTGAKFGSYSLRLTTTSPRSAIGNAMAAACAAEWSIYGTQLPTSPGLTYSASAWVKAGSGIERSYVFIAACAGSSQCVYSWTRTGWAAENRKVTLSSEWQRAEETWTIPQTLGQGGPVPDNLNLFVVAEGEFPAGAYMFIDGVQLEQKPFATPYIDTNGAQASRSGAARVQAPAAGILDGATGASYSSVVLADSPRTYWRLDDLTDASGNGNTLTDVGSTPMVSGLLTEDASIAREFDGTTHTMSAPSDPDLDVGDVFTLEAWIRLDSLPAAGSFYSIINKGPNGYQFGVNDTGQLFGAKAEAGYVVRSSVTLVAGVTYHVVWTKNPNSNTLYIDGANRTGAVTNQPIANNTSLLFVGSRQNANERFDGRIDEIAIYPTSLSATRVLAHRNTGAALFTGQSQGWVAVRIQPGWAASSSMANDPIVFDWRNGLDDRLTLYHWSQEGWNLRRRAGGTGTRVEVNSNHQARAAVTLVAAWTPTQLKLSVDGGAFGTTTNTTVPQLTAGLFDIGSAGTASGTTPLNGELHWFATGTGTLTDADAATIHAFGNTDPALTALPGAASMIWTAADNTFQRTSAIETKLVYEHVAVDQNDAPGKWETGRSIPHISQLTRVTEPAGNATGAANDYSTRFEYDAKGNVIRAIDPLGHITISTYNPNGTLASETLPDNGDGIVRTTTYNTYDANGLPTQITDAAGGITRAGYDAAGNNLWIQDANHASYSGGTPSQYRTEYVNDVFGRLIRSSSPKSTQFTPGLLLWSDWSYDANDNEIAEMAPHYGAGDSGGAPQTTTAYDAMDRATLVTSPDTSGGLEQTLTDYDAAGRIVKVTSPNGMQTPSLSKDFATFTTYDLLDRTSSVTEYEVDATDTPIAGRTRTINYCYDAAGDLRSITGPKGAASFSGCPTSSDPATYVPTTAPDTTVYTYDFAGRQVKETDALGQSTMTAYDENDQVIATRDENGNVTTHAYNARGEEVKSVEPFDTNPSAPRTITTVTEYDALGNVRREISPRGYDASPDKVTFTNYVTSYGYDALGRLVKTTLPTDASTPQAYVHQAYDANGNLLWVSLPTTQANPANVVAGDKTVNQYWDAGEIYSTSAPAAPTIRFEHTAEGWQSLRIPETAIGSGTLDFGRMMLWAYFADGNVREQRDAAGHRATYTYDADGNTTSITEALGAGNPSAAVPITVTATFNGFGELAKVRIPRLGTANYWATAFAYDQHGNVTQLVQNQEETAAGSIVTVGRTQTIVYDLLDRPTSQVDDFATPATADDEQATYTYTPDGLEAGRTLAKPNGTGGWINEQAATATYYANGLLRTLVTTDGGSPAVTVATHTLSYVANSVYLNGNRAADVFQLRGPDAGAACYATTCTASWEYDARDRLLKEINGTGTTTEYALDAVGNITQEKQNGSVVRTASYEGLRLVSDTVSGVGTKRYLYDSAGDLDCVLWSGGSQTSCPSVVDSYLVTDYLYDTKSRLIGTRSYSGGSLTDSADYVLDGLDRILSETEWHGGVSTRTEFSYIGLSNAVAEDRTFNASGTLTDTKSYAYDATGRRLTIAHTPAGSPAARYSYVYDAEDSVELLIDQNRTVKASYGYTPYGDSNLSLTKTAAGFSPSTNQYKYEGRRHDPGAKTIDFGARHYSPAIQRFLQRDSYFGALDDLGLATDPVLGNRYIFEGANPINFIEIDGHAASSLHRGGRPSPAGRTWRVMKAVAEVAPFTGTGISGYRAVRAAARGDFRGAVTNAAFALPGAGNIAKGARLGVQGAKAVRGAGAVKSAPTSVKKVPNPGGSRGGAAHRQKVEQRINELKSKGHTLTHGGNKKEEFIRTPGGAKSARRPDITTRAPSGSIHRENVGRQTRDGRPVKRERDALDDIRRATGKRPKFTAYNKPRG